MGNETPKNPEEQNNENSSEWQDMAPDATEAAAERPLEELSSEELDDRIDAVIERYYQQKESDGGSLSDEDYHAMWGEINGLQEARETALIRETAELLPESRRQEFIDTIRSKVGSSSIIEVIRKTAAGVPEADIKAELYKSDFGGAIEEINRLRADTIYDEAIEFMHE